MSFEDFAKRMSYYYPKLVTPSEFKLESIRGYVNKDGYAIGTTRKPADKFSLYEDRTHNRHIAIYAERSRFVAEGLDVFFIDNQWSNGEEITEGDIALFRSLVEELNQGLRDRGGFYTLFVPRPTNEELRDLDGKILEEVTRVIIPAPKAPTPTGFEMAPGGIKNRDGYCVRSAFHGSEKYIAPDGRYVFLVNYRKEGGGYTHTGDTYRWSDGQALTDAEFELMRSHIKEIAEGWDGWGGFFVRPRPSK